MKALLVILAYLAATSGGKKSDEKKKVQGAPIGAPGGFLDMFAKKAAADRKKNRTQ